MHAARMTRLLSFCLPLAAVLLASCASAPPKNTVAHAETSPPFTIERLREERKIPDGVDTLVIDNPYGEIQVRQTRAAAFAIQSIEQRIGEEPRIAALEWFQEGPRMGFRVRYKEHDPSTPANPRLGRVDLGVFIPAGYKLDLSTDFGLINLRRINNDVAATSRSGMINSATRGAMKLTSGTGEIRAWTMGYDWPAPTEISTNGHVIADIPVFAELDLAVTAANGIESDFPLDHQTQDDAGRWQGKRHSGTGRTIMRIVSGGIAHLQALEAPYPPRG